MNGRKNIMKTTCQLNPNLEQLIQSFNTELKRTLDKLVPEYAVQTIA